jgi:hypothetical protein
VHFAFFNMLKVYIISSVVSHGKFQERIYSSRHDTDSMLTSQLNSAERESESEGKGRKKS